ncbi:Filament-like plant protein 1, partial [Ophiophagus hannah]
NERLSKEIKKHTEHLKHLTSKLQKKEINYKKHDTDLATEIKKNEATYQSNIIADSDLQPAGNGMERQWGQWHKKRDQIVLNGRRNLTGQEEYNSKTKCMEEMEEKLQENVPLAEKLQKELEEISTSYTKQKEIYNELRDEESALKVGIERSLREIKRLERQKTVAKTELRRSRDISFEQLTSSTYSIKFIERDNYEIDRMLFILNGENARLRAIFFKYQHELLIILEEYVRRNTKRNVKVDYVHEGLQLNYEEMDSLLRSKSLPEANKYQDISMEVTSIYSQRIDSFVGTVNGGNVYTVPEDQKEKKKSTKSPDMTNFKKTEK